MDAFSPAAQEWFRSNFDAPTPVQEEGWSRIASGQHSLLIAPTGSGKTLAAFFYFIDQLGALPADAPAGVRVLYVSPLKALVYDIERNLRAPLVGIERTSQALGVEFRAPRVAVRTGDTPQRERRLQARDPAEILVTTPESLYLILGSQQRETLTRVETVIVDEIHALAPTKRGAHLALSLERLAALIESGDPQRIGLSATARPLERVGQFLGGDREVAIVDASRAPKLDLRISVPVPDMTRPGDLPSPPESGPADGEQRPQSDPSLRTGNRQTGRQRGSILRELGQREQTEAATSLWPAIYPRLLEQIRKHRSSIVFVNSRGLAERLAQRLNELAEEELVLAHHGSVAHEKRAEIEEALKAGQLRCIVATSSLELGIDMGAVDLVLMVESPGAVTRGLQRIGRAGHQVGETSRGILFPKHRSDLLEATVVSKLMREGAVEPIQLPNNPLDVLAQQIVAMCGVDRWDVGDLESVVRRAASFTELSRDALVGVLDMLSGRYPSLDFAELKPRILWDRSNDQLEGRRGANRIALTSGGTIPDRGLYTVHLGSEGPRIGELDEEMVHESRAGETVTLGASTWRITEITRDRVIVAPAPGEVGKLPFWHGDGPGRPIELGQRLGAFTREVVERCGPGADLHPGRAKAETWLQEEYALDEWAARNLVDYVIEQHDAAGSLPTDREITVERFRDELGDWRICILSPFGARIHAAWGLAIEAGLAAKTGFQLSTLWSDDGIMLRFADSDTAPELEELLPEPEDVEDLIVEQLAASALFAGQFRENAARALLLPRRRPGSRTPLWVQRLRAQNLLSVAREFPSFPIVLETYRACLQDVFDLPALTELLAGIRRREIRVREVETATASPFARSLVFAYTAIYLYQGDIPIAERRAQALTLDRNMLRDLLGQEELRDLLDAEVIEEIQAELQGRVEPFRARHVDGLHDLLRRLGDLTLDEAGERCDGPAEAWLAQLEASRRAVAIKLGGEERWIAAEDVALYRDSLGVMPPRGLPDSLLEASPRPLEQLAARYARTHGPFVTTELAERYALVPAQLEATLETLVAQRKLLSGDFHPRGQQREWCDVEVLRRLRRHTLARLRNEVAPVDGTSLGRFLPRWHGVVGASRDSLDEALARLEGVALPFSELERRVLPARVQDFEPRMLDERGALGQLVWVGAGALGERDGRVALYRRERIGLLADATEAEAEERSELERGILAHLGARGASFFAELAHALQPQPSSAVLDAVWDLVWAGLVTNDTFAPLRALAVPQRGRRRRGAQSVSISSGRWSLVSDLMRELPSETERLHARAIALLERHGVVSREVMNLENLSGGFSSLYPVFREMEQLGKLRRGHFVDGYSGAQFAYVAAVDRLRAARVAGEDRDVQLLAATDPANPYGALLPWPEPRAESPRLRRAAGASLVLADGTPALYLDRGGGRAVSFALPDELESDKLWTAVAASLRGLFRDRSSRGLCIEEIDAAPARQSRLAGAFGAAGFRQGYRGLELDRFDTQPAGS